MLDVLLVAATERELDGRDGLVCGVGPVEAAAATARALALRPFGAVLHVGVAGGRGLPPRTVVDRHRGDLRGHRRRHPRPVVDRFPIRAPRGCPRVRSPRRPPSRSRRARPSAADGPDRDHGAGVEAMEGFGVLRAAALAGVPALEVRAVSNEIGEEDRSRWDVAGAVAALQAALPLLLTALAAASRDAAAQR